MKDFLIDSSGNLLVTNFDLSFTPDFVQYTLQRLQIKLRTFYGEYFLDNSIGVPYFDKVLIKNPDADLITDLIKKEINSEPNVNKITAFTNNYDSSTRTLIITFTAELVDGSTLSTAFNIP